MTRGCADKHAMCAWCFTSGLDSPALRGANTSGRCCYRDACECLTFIPQEGLFWGDLFQPSLLYMQKLLLVSQWLSMDEIAAEFSEAFNKQVLSLYLVQRL